MFLIVLFISIFKVFAFQRVKYYNFSFTLFVGVKWKSANFCNQGTLQNNYDMDF